MSDKLSVAQKNRIVNNRKLWYSFGVNIGKTATQIAYEEALSNRTTAVNQKASAEAASPSVDFRTLRAQLENDYAAGRIDDAAYETELALLDEEELRQSGSVDVKGKKKTAAPAGSNTETTDNGKKHSYSYNNQTFLQQIQDFKRGIFPPYETFYLGETPEVLRNIGFVPLPMTLDQNHMSAMLYGSYKGSLQEKLDHMFPETEVKKIPHKIADPIAIIWDKRKGKTKPSESAIDVIVEMIAVSGKQVLVAIRVGGKGVVNSNTIDSNKVSTVHGNDDVLYRLSEAIDMHDKGMTSLFYINKDKTTNVFRSAGNPIPRGLNAIDGFIHSITDPGSPVKMLIANQTQTRQFKNWFRGSKIVNADGTPKVVYHGTNKIFTVFNSKSGAYWFSESEDYAESMMEVRGGGEVKAVYLNMRNPYRAKLSPGQFSDPGFEAPIIRAAKAANCDGVIIECDTADPLEADTFYVVFSPEQIKSATDNIGTFDSGDPDINHSFSPVESSEQAEDQAEGALAKVELNRENIPSKANGYLEKAENDLRRSIEKALSVPKGVSRESLKPIIQQISDEYLRTTADTRRLVSFDSFFVAKERLKVA